jgi:hypothetical protein
LLGVLYTALGAFTFALNNVTMRRGVVTGSVLQGMALTVPIGGLSFLVMTIAFGVLGARDVPDGGFHLVGMPGRRAFRDRRSRSGHHTRYAPLPVRGSVHLSRQFLEKLTDSAIIKVALTEDLSEVATGGGGLRLHPAVGEGRRRWRGTGSSNPSPSSGESSTNPDVGDLARRYGRPDGLSVVALAAVGLLKSEE